MLNILVPMAGEGSRFANAGYEKPKPFIDVNGIPMIERVLKNLDYKNSNFILIARKEHVEAEPDLVQSLSDNFNIKWVLLDGLTEGTACSVLFAHKFINNDTPLLIANSDQIVDGGVTSFIDDTKSRNLDGSIMTFFDKEKNPKWSFARVNDNGFVEEVKEKEAISNYATVGIYFFSKGRYFVDAAIDMFVRGDKVNSEYYVCPTYNYLVEEKDIGVFEISQDAMHGLGTPNDLEKFISSL